MDKVTDNEQKVNIEPPKVVCSCCGAINSILWDKKQVGIDDKAGTWLTLELYFCQECGNIKNYDLY